MKNSIYLMSSMALLLFFSGCSSSKVLSSWKADNADTAKSNNFIVFARTANTQTRIAFENEIVKQMSEKGMKSSASFTKFPKINPDQDVTEEKVKEIMNTLKGEGYNGVVLTVLKQVEDVTETTQDGGYYQGGNYYGYPLYYGGFNGYYRNPMSYSTLGNYVPESTTTRTSKNYILETVIYNLDETDDKQLVAVVTSKIEDPENASTAASDYVKGIIKSFEVKKTK